MIVYEKAQNINDYNWEITEATCDGEEIEFTNRSRHIVDYNPPEYEVALIKLICEGITTNHFHAGDKLVVSTNIDGKEYSVNVEILKEMLHDGA